MTTSYYKKRITLICFLALVLIALDQLLKIYVKTHFELGEAKIITSWFWICFVENNGMAFGLEVFSKIILTIFRLAAMLLLLWYIILLFKLKIGDFKIRWGYLVCVVFIFSGAVGNILDSLFYGILWNYAPFFYGKVVDMFHFPLIHNSAGEVVFFRPVFNLADSFITCAVFAILIFYREDLNISLSKR